MSPEAKENRALQLKRWPLTQHARHSSRRLGRPSVMNQTKWSMTNSGVLFHCFAVRSSSTATRMILWPVKQRTVRDALSANQGLACYDLGIWVPFALLWIPFAFRQRKFNKLQLSTSWRGEKSAALLILYLRTKCSLTLWPWKWTFK